MPPPENRFKNKYYPVEWGSEFFQTISSMLIIDPKFVIIMIELIKNTISNKLQEIGKSIEKKYQNEYEKLQRQSNYYAHPTEPQLSWYNCQMRFKTTAGTVTHKRASTKCNANHINLFLDDFVLRHYNTTEAEKHYIREAYTEANQFGSNKHYEEAYQHLIDTFASQIKYSLTSLQPCVNSKKITSLLGNW